VRRHPSPSTMTTRLNGTSQLYHNSFTGTTLPGEPLGESSVMCGRNRGGDEIRVDEQITVKLQGRQGERVTGRTFYDI
jgi:hypothetical protein